MQTIHNCISVYQRRRARKQLNASNGCLERVHDWMASKLNEDKMQIIWLGTRHQLNKTLPQMLMLLNGTVLQF